MGGKGKGGGPYGGDTAREGNGTVVVVQVGRGDGAMMVN